MSAKTILVYKAKAHLQRHGLLDQRVRRGREGLSWRDRWMVYDGSAYNFELFLSRQKEQKKENQPIGDVGRTEGV